MNSMMALSGDLAVNTRVVVFTLLAGELKVLLVRQAEITAPGQWLLPGGEIGPQDDIEHCARRRLAESSGLDGIYLEQLYTFGGSDGEAGITVAHVGLASPVTAAVSPAEQAHWFEMDRLPTLTRGHQRMIAMAYERLAAKMEYSTIACRFLPDEFTLGELQGVYEILLGQPVDKRNFRKSVLARKHLEATGRKRMNGAHRPASLYRVKKPGKVEYIR